MNKLRKFIAASFVLLFGSLLMNGAVAQSPTQVLDQLELTSADGAQRTNAHDPNRDEDIEGLFHDSDPVIDDLDLVSCTRVPGGDLLCLDGRDKRVMAWNGSSLSEVFRCDDKVLELKKSTLCTAYTFGLGVHAVAGVGKGKSYSLLGVEVDSENEIENVTEIATGRPLLTELKVVQDEVAAKFPSGSGYVGIEQRSDAVFFSFPVIKEAEVLFNKKAWGIRGKVRLQSVDIWQKNNTEADPDTVDNYVVAVISDGRIVAREIGGSQGLIELFDIVAARNIQDAANSPFAPSQCNFDDQHWSIEVSERTGIWYLTDKNFCQVTALIPQTGFDPVTGLDGKLVGLNIVQETPSVGGARNLILSTVETITVEEVEVDVPHPPVSATTSEGVTFDLGAAACAGEEGEGCVFLTGQGGVPAATFAQVSVVPGTGDATGFQLKGLPFCPYKLDFCLELVDPNNTKDWRGRMRQAKFTALENLNVLFPLPGSGHSFTSPRPEEYVFNVTPILPQVVQNQIALVDPGDPDGPRRPLWMLPEWRARIDLQFFFEALFFATNAQNKDVWTLTLDVAELHGEPDSELGCEEAADFPEGFLPVIGIEDDGLDRLLNLDVTTRVSERDKTINGPQSTDMGGFINNYQNTMVNAGCGSTRSRTPGASLFAYDLEPSWCQGTYDASLPVPKLLFDEGIVDEDEVQNAVCVLDDTGFDDVFNPIVEIPDDAVYAKLYVKLYDELLASLDELACPLVNPPFDSGACNDLDAIWANGKDKLTKALQATILPMKSTGSRNFGAVQSQLDNYLERLILITVTAAQDPDNRLGEQKARVETLDRLLNDKFLLSIPPAPDGFQEFEASWAE